MLVLACALGANACSHRRAATALPSPSPLPVATGAYPVFGHAADYSWLAGRLEHSLSCAYLVFEDSRRAPWGGRLPLIDRDGRLQTIASGDAVVVKGDLDRIGDGSCGTPAYVVRTVEEH
ncbi:MAG: hypothetical protein M3Z37_01305 [Candidatus Eremiobacteraeota bacterium]|nr:hypothetical protein [Candidatus Eremiobacteraeota bacterium]